MQQRKTTKGDSTYTIPEKREQQTFIKYRTLIILGHIQNTTYWYILGHLEYIGKINILRPGTLK